MGLVKRVRIGERLPTGYRMVWRDYDRGQYVAVPLGIHWIARAMYRVWLWSLMLEPYALEIEFDRVESKVARRIDDLERQLFLERKSNGELKTRIAAMSAELSLLKGFIQKNREGGL